MVTPLQRDSRRGEILPHATERSCKAMNATNNQNTVAASPSLEPHGNWFALSVTARHEKVVAEMLRYKGFETFLPLYRRRHQYVRRYREFDLPVFPGYLFCRTDLSTRLPIMTTPGVVRMVGAGRTPIPVDHTEIVSLQKATAAGTAVAPHPFLQCGQVGRVIVGPLAGVEGIVIKSKHSARLILSVTLLQRAVQLEIDSDCVIPVANAATAACGRV
jgi:transcription antitermination factor NusG